MSLGTFLFLIFSLKPLVLYTMQVDFVYKRYMAYKKKDEIYNFSDDIHHIVSSYFFFCHLVYVSAPHLKHFNIYVLRRIFWNDIWFFLCIKWINYYIIFHWKLIFKRLGNSKAIPKGHQGSVCRRRGVWRPFWYNLCIRIFRISILNNNF